MKIEKLTDGRVGCAITYNANETIFIDTLDEECRKNIFRGIAIPEDYGYDPQCIYFKIFKIDGQRVVGTPLTRDKFIKKFNELNNMLMDDTKSYYVLYEEENAFPWSVGQYKEIFWCIPTSEINFRSDPEGGWMFVGGVTLCEEEFEFCDDSENDYKLSYEESYDLKIEIYEDFEKKFSHYLLHDNRANEITFKLWKAFENHISSAQTRSIKMDNKFYLITWLEHNWGAFLGCILDGSFKYMNVASLVLESWNEK